MRHFNRISTIAALCGQFVICGSAMLCAGCHDDTPPPPRVPVPVPSSDSQGYGELRERDSVRPLPPPTAQVTQPPVPFHDEPIVEQALPQQPEFVEMYRKVGSPKITLFVNRTLQGDLLPVNANEPAASVVESRSSNGPVNVESHDSYSQDSDGSDHVYRGWYDSHGGWHAYTQSDSSDKFESKGPAEYHETTEVYLQPSQYDDVQAKSLDYEAVENIMTDWMASQGQVTVISPLLARQRLSDEQVKELQAGRPQMLSEVAEQLGADVLIQVQAHPTRQTPEGLEVRLVAEAMNTHGGQSLARATVDMEPPLTKTQINRYTRFLAAKLMTGMTETWSAPPPPEMRRDAQAEPAPTPPPTPPPAAAPAPVPAPAATSSGANAYPPEAAPFSSGTTQPAAAPTTLP